RSQPPLLWPTCGWNNKILCSLLYTCSILSYFFFFLTSSWNVFISRLWTPISLVLTVCREVIQTGC
ncbi:unnamed protein product, partial [Amoebophrya sp. A120]